MSVSIIERIMKIFVKKMKMKKSVPGIVKLCNIPKTVT